MMLRYCYSRTLVGGRSDPAAENNVGPRLSARLGTHHCQAAQEGTDGGVRRLQAHGLGEVAKRHPRANFHACRENEHKKINEQKKMVLEKLCVDQ